MKLKEIFIDVETTGDNRYLHHIWSISAIVAIDGVKMETRTWRMNPNLEYANFEMMQSKLGVSKEDLQEFDKPEVAILSFINFLGQYVDHENAKDKFFFIAFNSRFDFDFVIKWFSDCNKRKFFFNNFYSAHICVSVLSAFMLQKIVHLLPNFKLETLAELFGLKHDVHDSESDIEVTYEIYRNLQNAITIDKDKL